MPRTLFRIATVLLLSIVPHSSCEWPQTCGGTSNCANENSDNDNNAEPGGACCRFGGECVMVSAEPECNPDTGLLGTYLGDGSTCEEAACVTGACCIGDDCFVLTQDGCIFDFGTFHGEGTACSDSLCP